MKNRRTGLIVALVVVLSLLVLAPSMALSDSNSSKNSSVTIRVETDKPSYLRGQVVKIKVYVINSKNEAVMYPTMIGYSVYNSKGGNVVGCYVCITWASPIPTFPPQSETLFQSLSSGDSTFEWNQKMQIEGMLGLAPTRLKYPSIVLKYRLTPKSLSGYTQTLTLSPDP
jgi:hypothetical protein